jgi:hypothetical protein
LKGLGQTEAAEKVGKRKELKSQMKETMKKVRTTKGSSKENNSQPKKATNEGKKIKGKKRKKEEYPK